MLDEIEGFRRIVGCGHTLMKWLLRSLVRRSATAVARQLGRQSIWDDLLMLQGVQAAMLLQQRDHLAALADAEFKVFSQWGEDGIIEWLVTRLPGIPQSFVEFGVETYTEANTCFLLRHRNWRGLIIDGDASNIESVRGRPLAWRHDLTAVAAFVTRENINDLIGGAGFSGEIGILSIDIDGNDYWVWDAINVVNPWIVIVEYNAVLGDLKPLSISYDPNFRRMRAHSSALYYGASLAAFEQLAAKRGYGLAGGNSAGNNLFFVRNDIAAKIFDTIEDRRARPSLYAESRDAKGALSQIRGTARRALIDNMPISNLSSGKMSTLAEMGDLYSPYWLALMKGAPLPKACS